MPSKGQLSRGRRRPKTRALRAARRKQSSCQAGNQEKNTEMVSSTSGNAPEDQAIMADRPKPGPRAFLCGIQACYSLVKVWACKHSRLLLFGVCALLMLLFYCYLSASECHPGFTGRGPLGGREGEGRAPKGGALRGSTKAIRLSRCVCPPVRPTTNSFPPYLLSEAPSLPSSPLVLTKPYPLTSRHFLKNGGEILGT